MDDPVEDVRGVIYKLTTGTREVQQQALEQYFTSDASFMHPFCSIKGNRDTILRIFQWYKILSPHIDIQVNSVAYDEWKSILYVNISQTFKIWFAPFYSAPVNLTTMLELVQGDNLNAPIGKRLSYRTSSSNFNNKYYIKSQNDLYQVNEFVKFFLPFGVGTTFVMLWHWFATLCCIVGARVLGPVQWLFADVSEILRSEPGSGRPSPNGRATMDEQRRQFEETLYRQQIEEAYPARKGTRKIQHQDDIDRELLMNS